MYSKTFNIITCNIRDFRRRIEGTKDVYFVTATHFVIFFAIIDR